MLDLIGTAGEYLTPPARRPDWHDTWTMQRTRRHAMTSLGANYAGARRTFAGAVAVVLLVGGAYLIGLGSAGVGGTEQLAATGILAGGVLTVLIGLGVAGYVLFTGARVVKALRAWHRVRDLDGGPGGGVLLTAGLLLRLLLAVLALAAGVGMVLVRVEVLAPGWLTGTPGGGPGSMLWQWSAAVVTILAGIAALSGFTLASLALRRPRAQTADSSGPAASSAGPAGADGHAADSSGATAGAVPAPAPIDDIADTRLAGDVPGRTEATPTVAAILPDGRRLTGTGITLVGRSPAAGGDEPVAAAVTVEDASVSKTHLAIRIEGESIWATDRASTNGTDLYRSGQRYTLVPWEEAPLQAGDELVLGAAIMNIDKA